MYSAAGQEAASAPQQELSGLVPCLANMASAPLKHPPSLKSVQHTADLAFLPRLFVARGIFTPSLPVLAPFLAPAQFGWGLEYYDTHSTPQLPHDSLCAVIKDRENLGHQQLSFGT